MSCSLLFSRSSSSSYSPSCTTTLTQHTSVKTELKLIFLDVLLLLHCLNMFLFYLNTAVCLWLHHHLCRNEYNFLQPLKSTGSQSKTGLNPTSCHLIKKSLSTTCDKKKTVLKSCFKNILTAMSKEA